MITAFKNKIKEKQTNKITEKSADVIIAIMKEIESLEAELGELLVENYRKSKFSNFKSFSDEKLVLFNKHAERIIKFSESAYMPFYIHQAINHPYIDPIESIVHIYTECEEWMKNNEIEVKDIVFANL